MKKVTYKALKQLYNRQFKQLPSLNIIQVLTDKQICLLCIDCCVFVCEADLRIRRQHSSESMSSINSAASHSSMGSAKDADDKKKKKKSWVSHCTKLHHHTTRLVHI